MLSCIVERLAGIAPNEAAASQQHPDWSASQEQSAGRKDGSFVTPSRGCSLLRGHGNFSTLKVGGWHLVAVGGSWRQLVVGDWWLVGVGGWRLGVGGGWRLTVGGPSGLSLAKGKILLLNDSPGDIHPHCL